jgi:RimJ/RimL family protein N-acetyltransferase
MKKLSAKLITLEKINSKHIEEGWLDWLNQKQNLKLLNNPTKKYTKKKLLKYLVDLKKNKDIMFAVRIKATNKYVGNIKINHIDHIHKSCGYGRLLGSKTHKGKKYGLLMLYKICEYAFENLKMNKIFTPVFSDNYNSLRSNIEFGMRVSGYFKDHFKKQNKFKDVYYFELTKKEFKKIKNKYK